MRKAQSGGGNSKIKESMAKDFENSLDEFLQQEIEEKGLSAYFSEKDPVNLYNVQAALNTALEGIKDDITDMTFPTNKNMMVGKSVTNNFSFRYKGNKIEISKWESYDSSRFYYSINGGENNILARNKFGWFANSGDFNEGLKSLLNKMKKM